MPDIIMSMKGEQRCKMPLTEENRDGLLVLFFTSKVYVDEDGNEHYQILAPLGRSTQGQEARRNYINKYGKDKLLALLNAQRKEEEAAEQAA